jgi:hypothetical protein
MSSEGAHSSDEEMVKDEVVQDSPPLKLHSLSRANSGDYFTKFSGHVGNTTELHAGQVRQTCCDVCGG